MVSGAGIYFDGITSARHAAVVLLAPEALQIASADGRLLDTWPYDEIEGVAAPDTVLRIGRRGNTVLARLEISDPDFAAQVDGHAIYVDRTGVAQRRQRTSVIGWSIAATVSLLLVAYFGLPAIAARLAPLLPAAVDRKLGDAVEIQLRGILDTKNTGAAFECTAVSGRGALDKIVHRLEAAAGFPSPLHSIVVRRPEANALALPGGQVFVFSGLIEKADSADEVAGVIAHEMGHVAHRDGAKAVLQAGGLSFLFGMLLGDFVGGGAVVIAAKSVLQSSYTREAEAAADAFGAELMVKANSNPRALGSLLSKVGGATEPGMKILLDHPDTKARIAAINRVAPARTITPFLNAGEWAALKRICAS
jgi:Zn-dependent protease with chaperone function